MKTTDANKLFLPIFERTMVYVAVACLCQKGVIVTRGVILHSLPKKRALINLIKNGLSPVWRHLLGRSFCRHPYLQYILVEDHLKHLHGLFFIKNQPQTETPEGFLWNLFQGYYQLPPWVQRLDKGLNVCNFI